MNIHNAIGVGVILSLCPAVALAQGVEGAPVGELEEITPPAPGAADAPKKFVPPEPTQTPAETEELHAAFARGERKDAGLYFSLGVGAGSFVTLGKRQRQVSGGGLAASLLVGTFTTPSLVVGAGVVALWVASSDVKISNSNVFLEPTVNQGMLAPFIKYYPWEDNGMYVFGMVGVSGTFVSTSSVVVKDEVVDQIGESTQVGLGEALGIGFDWTSEGGVGVGAMGRIVATNFFGADQSIVFSNVLTPSAVIELTYY